MKTRLNLFINIFGENVELSERRRVQLGRVKVEHVHSHSAPRHCACSTMTTSSSLNKRSKAWSLDVDCDSRRKMINKTESFEQCSDETEPVRASSCRLLFACASDSAWYRLWVWYDKVEEKFGEHNDYSRETRTTLERNNEKLAASRITQRMKPPLEMAPAKLRSCA